MNTRNAWVIVIALLLLVGLFYFLRTRNITTREGGPEPAPTTTTASAGAVDITTCSWNLKDFGKSKSDAAISFIAQTIKGVDILAIQEVVAGNGGSQAVARLADALNRTGGKWEYVISDPTTSKENGTERYAYIWKPSRVKKVGDAWLEKKWSNQIDREPYMATFQTGNKFFTMASFHAIPKSKQPESEIKYLQYVPEEYPGKNLIFAGDFNLSESHSVFNTLKSLRFLPVFTGQKTSLRTKCVNNDCLASEYDNIFCNRQHIRVRSSGVIQFYKKFTTIKEALKVSDHIPVYMQFSVN